MDTDTHLISAEHRLVRIRSALVESGIGSTSGLVSWLSVLYRREPDRAAHVHRVARASLSIGEQLRATEDLLRQVERAAMLHDLGRFVLVDHECDSDDGASGRRVRQAIAAQAAVSVLPYLRPAGEMIGAMWERTDGTGWPLGLAGDQIPLGARILSVADALDALLAICAEMSLPVDVLALELVRHAGTRFDPAVVAAVVRWLDGAPLGVPKCEAGAPLFL